MFFWGCVDGTEDLSNPCEQKLCENGQWLIMVIDCLPPHMCKSGVWIDPAEDECCGMCVEDIGNHT